MRSCLSSIFRNVKKFSERFFLEKTLRAGPENAGFHFRKYKKSFILRKHKKVFQKRFFLRKNIRNFLGENFEDWDQKKR